MCTTCGCGHQEMSHEEMHRLGIAEHDTGGKR